MVQVVSRIVEWRFRKGWKSEYGQLIELGNAGSYTFQGSKNNVGRTYIKSIPERIN